MMNMKSKQNYPKLLQENGHRTERIYSSGIKPEIIKGSVRTVHSI